MLQVSMAGRTERGSSLAALWLPNYCLEAHLAKLFPNLRKD